MGEDRAAGLPWILVFLEAALAAGSITTLRFHIFGEGSSSSLSLMNSRTLCSLLTASYVGLQKEIIKPCLGASIKPGSLRLFALSEFQFFPGLIGASGMLLEMYRDYEPPRNLEVVE